MTHKSPDTTPSQDPRVENSREFSRTFENSRVSDRDSISGPKTAVFAGSFDPFTVGHADIVERGLAIFDNIIICIGVNINKPGAREAARERASDIAAIYADCPRVSVECHDGLTTDFALARGACALLRGVRSVKDFEYERDMADANRALSGLETVILMADPRYAWVSSSLVRELRAYGRDTSSMIPKTSTQPDD